MNPNLPKLVSYMKECDKLTHFVTTFNFEYVDDDNYDKTVIYGNDDFDYLRQIYESNYHIVEGYIEDKNGNAYLVYSLYKDNSFVLVKDEFIGNIKEDGYTKIEI